MATAKFNTAKAVSEFNGPANGARSDAAAKKMPRDLHYFLDNTNREALVIFKRWNTNEPLERGMSGFSAPEIPAQDFSG